MVILIIGIAIGVYLIRRQQIYKSKANLEGTRIEIVDNSGNPVTSTSSRSVKVKLTYVAPSPTPVLPALSPTPGVSASPSASPAPTPPPANLTGAYSPKVLLLIYNPIIESQGGRRLTAVEGWNDPVSLTNTFINSMNTASRGFVNYQVAETLVLDAFPVHEVDPADPQYSVNGFVYDDASYLTCAASNFSRLSCYKPNQEQGAGYLADYRRMIQAADACTKRNNGTIDELWIWGGPGFGFWEANLAGPNAFYYNSGPTTGTTCTKLLPIMGFAYHVEEARMWEDFAHRLESTMKRVFGSWAADYGVTSATAQHDWDRFTMLDNQSSGNGGCGNAHTSVNSTQVSGAYDWSSTNTTRSSCRNFANYPNLGNTTENINCNAWGCTDLGYFKDWLFKYLPNNSGSDNGKLNNWWKYLVDPQRTIIDGSVQGVAYAQEAYPTHFKIANTQENLAHVPEQLFDSNPKQIDWQLLSDNGQKTVYAQFKINNTWSSAYSVNIQLTGQPLSAFGMGMEAGQQFDTNKVDLVAESNASWVRLNFIVRDSWSGVDDPQFINTYNTIINAYTQRGIKILGLIGVESVKQGFDRSKPLEFQNRLVDVADKITQTFGDRVKVYEIFNEPNDWAGGSSSQLSPESFTSLLNAVYQKVRIDRNRTDLKLISGPIFSHDLSGGGSGDTGGDYLRSVYSAFNQNNPYPLDAVGLHIYIEQGNSQRAAIESAIRRNLEGIKRVIREFDPDKKIWISEMGWGTGSVSEEVQANNLETVFNLLKNDSAVRMAMWFTLLDFDNREYGLIRGNGNRKQAFQKFTSIASQLNPSPASSPSPAISPTPSAGSTTTPSLTPIPTSSPSPAPVMTPIPSSTPSPSPAPTTGPGRNADFNGDGKINSIDVSLMFRSWNSRASSDLNKYDLNSDGVVNSFDYSFLIRDFSN